MRIDGEGVKTLPRANRLRLIDGPGGTKPKPEGEQLSLEELEDWMDSLPANFLKCRIGRGRHNMIERDTWPIGRRGEAGTLWRCTSCKVEVTEFTNAAGFIVDVKGPKYPKGYLAPKGAGRASTERNALLRKRRIKRALLAKKP